MIELVTSSWVRCPAPESQRDLLYDLCTPKNESGASTPGWSSGLERPLWRYCWNKQFSRIRVRLCDCGTSDIVFRRGNFLFMLQATFYFCNVLLFIGSFYPTFYQDHRVFARFLSEYKYSISLAAKEVYLRRIHGPEFPRASG